MSSRKLIIVISVCEIIYTDIPRSAMNFLNAGELIPLSGSLILSALDFSLYGFSAYFSGFLRCSTDSSKSSNSTNYTQCDSLLMGNKCGAHTIPYIKNKNANSNIAHEATTSKISDEQLHYCQQRGLNSEEAVSLIVNGFCKEVLQQLPMEFAVEAQKLVGIRLEGSVG